MNDEKKHVLMICPMMFDNSPYCIFNHSHAMALTQKGYNVTVLVWVAWNPAWRVFRKNRKEFYKKANSRLLIDGVEVVYIKSMSFSSIFDNCNVNPNGYLFFKKVKKYIKRYVNLEEVIYIDAHFIGLGGYIVKKLKEYYPNIKMLVTCHGTRVFEMVKTELGRRKILDISKSADKMIAVSNKLAKEIINCGCKNVAIIYNGIDFHDVEEKVDIKRNKYAILYVGGLIKRKNPNLIIEAISQLDSSIKDKIILKIIGSGQEYDYLKELVEKNNLKNNVVFLGNMENSEVQKIMKSSNIFIMPSINEGFGIVYSEAMYNGCITIGTKNEGIDGFIKNEINGFLIEPNVKHITKLLECIYNNEYDLESIRQNGITSASNLSWENNTSEYLEIINNL